MLPSLEAAFQRASSLALTTTGRRSGTPHRVVLWFTFADGIAYLLAHVGPRGAGPDWYRNLLAEPLCWLEAGGQRTAGRAAPQAALEQGVRDAFRAKYGQSAYDSWYAGTPRLPVAIVLLPDAEPPSPGG